ncbi:MAG: hypothetical protein KBT15_02910 [Bacteroidales bacterium]|nr:hypothetical protein [Candidatus Minthousia equi]
MKNQSIIMHALYEPVRNEEGVAYDALCHGANKAFENFYGLNPKGKMRSEFLGVSNLLIVNRMDEILKTGKSMVFCYEETGLGVLDVIMESHGDGKCVDIYTINMKEVKELQQKQNEMYRKYYIASNLNNLAVWQWEIKEHKVYADSIITDATGKEQVDMTREQLVWEEFDRLHDIYEEDQHLLQNMLYDIRDKKITQGKIQCRLMHEGKLISCEISAIADRYDMDGNPESVIATTRVL